jgi:hypothetical protein
VTSRVDPTSGLLASEGHIPLACTPEPISAAPITGTASQRAEHFDFTLRVARLDEVPRVTKPYTDEEWKAINLVGRHVDNELRANDVRLTMGGEPTFVSVDDMEGAEWKTEAMGPNKRRLAGELLSRLKRRFAAGALLHIGQGKWYPGKSCRVGRCAVIGELTASRFGVTTRCLASHLKKVGGVLMMPAVSAAFSRNN